MSRPPRRGVGWRTGRLGGLCRVEGRRSLALGIVSIYSGSPGWFEAFLGVSSGVEGVGGGGHRYSVLLPPIPPRGLLLLGIRCLLGGLVRVVLSCVGVCGCAYIPAFCPALPPRLPVPPS